MHSSKYPELALNRAAHQPFRGITSIFINSFIKFYYAQTKDKALNWQSDINNWEGLEEEKVDFALQEAKLCLEYSLDASDKLDQKAFIILASSFTILSGFLGYMVAHYDAGDSFLCQDWSILFPASLMALLQIVVCLKLIAVISPRKFVAIGNEPKVLFTKKICSQKLSYIKASEVQLYQGRIDSCNEIGRYKSTGIIHSIKIMFWSVPTSFLTFLIIKITLSLFS